MHWPGRTTPRLAALHRNSHLLEALEQTTIDDGLTVARFTVETLGRLVTRHRADDTVARAVNRVPEAELVVIDDMGCCPPAESRRW